MAYSKEPLKNPGLRFLRETAEVQLKRAGVTVGDYRRHAPVQPTTEDTRAPDGRFAERRFRKG